MWHSSPSSSRHHLSYDDCLEDERENYQNCSVLCCVWQLCTALCCADRLQYCSSGGLMHQKDEELRRDLSELLAFLVFDEMATVQEWYDCAVL